MAREVRQVSDERISEPPALEGEVLRWYSGAGTNGHTYARCGLVHAHGVGAAASRWYICGDRYDNEALHRLAAELAACRAHDEGDAAPVDAAATDAPATAAGEETAR